MKVIVKICAAFFLKISGDSIVLKYSVLLVSVIISISQQAN